MDPPGTEHHHLMRLINRLLLSLLLVVPAASLPRAADAESVADAFGARTGPEWRDEKDRQYDFWLGEWEGRWRFRQKDEFFHSDISMKLRHWLFPVLDGKAIVELSLSEDHAPGNRVAGFSIRYFDPAKDRWVMAQDWPGWTQRGFLDQLQGFEREGRVQVFSTYYTGQGQRRTRRYTFSDVREDYFRWDSASTADNGWTWSQGTIVEFHRTAAVAALPGPGEPMPNVPEERFCGDEGYLRLDALVGEWVPVADSTSVSDARLVAVPFNAGCGVMAVLTQGAGGPRIFYAWTHVPGQAVWTQLSLADSREATHRLWTAGAAEDQEELVFEANDSLVIRDELEVVDLSELTPASTQERTVWRLQGEVLRYTWEKRVAEEWRSELELELRRATRSTAD